MATESSSPNYSLAPRLRLLSVDKKQNKPSRVHLSCCLLKIAQKAGSRPSQNEKNAFISHLLVLEVARLSDHLLFRATCSSALRKPPGLSGCSILAPFIMKALTGEKVWDSFTNRSFKMIEVALLRFWLTSYYSSEYQKEHQKVY